MQIRRGNVGADIYELEASGQGQLVWPRYRLIEGCFLQCRGNAENLRWRRRIIGLYGKGHDFRLHGSPRAIGDGKDEMRPARLRDQIQRACQPGATSFGGREIKIVETGQLDAHGLGQGGAGKAESSDFR